MSFFFRYIIHGMCFIAIAALSGCVSTETLDAVTDSGATQEETGVSDVGGRTDTRPPTDTGGVDGATDAPVQDTAPADTGSEDVGPDGVDDTDTGDVAVDAVEDPSTDAGLPCTDSSVCTDGLVCVDGVCAPPVCIPDERACEDSTTLGVCDEEGASLELVDCTAATDCTAETCICDGAACARIEACTPGERRCSDENVERCLDDGTRYVVTDTCDAERGLSCVEGTCRCGDGELLCDGECVDPRLDELHCGRCSNPCAEFEICVDATCGCTPGFDECSGVCTNTVTDPNNCGDCGVRCNADQSCSAGDCACPPGEAVCGAGCADFATDPANCGACGRACGAGQTCSGGTCVCEAVGLTLCDGACVDTATDESYCGSCGISCGAGATCVAGSCECEPGTTNCGGACVNTRTDPNNCGTCGNRCATTCSAGVCETPACECIPILETYCEPGPFCSAPQGCCAPIFPGCIVGVPCGE